MSGAKKYSGSCHCGAVRYEAELDLTKPVISCNCSICLRTGALLAFTPSDRFTLLSGEDSLTDYLFNNHVIHHLFCRVCGIRAFSRAIAPDGTPTVAVNTRCLDGVDLGSLKLHEYDGKSK
jgi:hypothetical protein